MARNLVGRGLGNQALSVPLREATVERAALASFLRRRRTALPATQALGRRRTPGLRRDEVAERAHISVDYYKRLEQARGARPSPPVLQALGDALELGGADVARLFRLAGHEPPIARVVPRTVRPHVADLLDRVGPAAVIATAADYEVIAANAHARLLLPDLTVGTNLARRFFRDRLAWSSAGDDFADVAVARLRAAATRYPADDTLQCLVAGLRAASQWFDALWASEPTTTHGRRHKTIPHATLGAVPVTCDVLLVPDDDQQIVFMTPEPGTSAAAALHELYAAAS
ncbi:MAG: helix-turn-helix domain-containing protein [Frankiales bacterium]|nr:helix-turn-helix domain-containing protein [Frankiales bacterium]